MGNHENVQEQSKLDWNIPELEVLDLNENTLAAGGLGADMGTFS